MIRMKRRKQSRLHDVIAQSDRPSGHRRASPLAKGDCVWQRDSLVRKTEEFEALRKRIDRLSFRLAKALKAGDNRKAAIIGNVLRDKIARAQYEADLIAAKY